AAVEPAGPRRAAGVAEAEGPQAAEELRAGAPDEAVPAAEEPGVPPGAGEAMVGYTVRAAPPAFAEAGSVGVAAPDARSDDLAAVQAAGMWAGHWDDLAVVPVAGRSAGREAGSAAESVAVVPDGLGSDSAAALVAGKSGEAAAAGADWAPVFPQAVAVERVEAWGP